ncbi:DNA polymerase III subunit delta, partial [Streptococcus agalactiae]|nr:DNA polymerase III subunit delta [Streptococcus agalactiae]
MIAIEEIGRITPDNLGLVTVLAGEDLGQYAQMKEKLFQVIGFNKDDLAYSYFDLSEEDYQNAELD